MRKISHPAAVFLDRDGTINPDVFGYIHDAEKYYLYPYAAEAINLLHEMGFYVLLVTNQSGIARGYFTVEQLESVHYRMRELLAEGGAYLDKIYYSPYFGEGTVEPYNVEHEDRKPGLGMFHQAKREFKIRPEHSWMIGDRYSDIAFGVKAGMKTILLLSGHGEKVFRTEMKLWDCQPDFVVRDLLAAAKLINSL